MLTKRAARPGFAHVSRKFAEYRSDEGGAITIFVVMMFIFMLLLGGIAVDVMRFEMRRVALQETLDRATLAAANVVLPPSQSPASVVTEWFNKAGLGDELTVDYFAPTVGGVATASSREAWARAKVRSYNHFMHLLAEPYFEGDTVAIAQQGVSKIEVMMVLDITGSMVEASGSTTKIAALKQAATNFLTILKYSKDTAGNYTIDKDPNDLISIGLVPYSSNVNIPVALRNQFTVSNLSSWNGIANAGVPGINCFEIEESSWDETALSTSTAIRMAAVADTYKPNTIPNPSTTTNTFGGTVALSFRSPLNTGSGSSASVPYKDSSNVYCNDGQNYSTGADEAWTNLVKLPTTDITGLQSQILAFKPRGTTSIAVGMRWGTALMDDTARPIYGALLGGEAAMAGRPADNTAPDTRKIIVLMTDGNHVASKYIKDAYKSGPSPIWRGTDGNLAIRYTAGGPALTDGARPFVGTGKTCSNWDIQSTQVNGVTVVRDFFVPHLKASSVKRKLNAGEAEGMGTGTSYTGGCDPRAWVAGPTPSWPGSGTVSQLDWSEVWRYVRVDWVVQQLYMRSGVPGTSSYNTVYNMFVGNFLTSVSNMDSLLDTNCTAAKAAGFEVFGIVLGDDITPGPIMSCSSPGTGYFYHVTKADDLNAAFEQIAVLISDLKLTQ